MDVLESLFRLTDAYRAARSLSDARVSTLVFGAGHRIRSLRAGGDIGVRRLHAAFEWFSVHWPKGAAWPEGVPRPEVTEPEGVG